jgi:thiamine transport system ATP-binding protein
MLKLETVTLQQGGFALRADMVLSAPTTAVIGPSGGGKSTLLSAIAGFLQPVSGRIFWDTQDITALPPGQRPVAMLFQDNNLFPHLSIGQNIGLGMTPKRLTPDQKKRVSEVLTQVGLPGMDSRKPAELSGGQQSRAALARVLVQDRPLVLLDEPFAALGPGLKDDMLALAQEVLISAGRQLIMVTHDPKDARSAADQVVFVDQGQAQDPVATKAFFDTHNADVRAYLGAE